MPEIMKTQQWPQDWKRSVFIPVPQKGKTEECSNYCTVALISHTSKDFSGGLDGKASAYNAGNLGLIPGSERPRGEGNGNPLQYSCLENPMDGGDWQATVHGVLQAKILEQVANKAEVDVFLELSCFFSDPMTVGNLISGSSAFLKSSLHIWKFTVHVLLETGLDIFEHYFASM